MKQWIESISDTFIWYPCLADFRFISFSFGRRLSLSLSPPVFVCLHVTPGFNCFASNVHFDNRKSNKKYSISSKKRLEPLTSSMQSNINIRKFNMKAFRFAQIHVSEWNKNRHRKVNQFSRRLNVNVTHEHTPFFRSSDNSSSIRIERIWMKICLLSVISVAKESERVKK